MAAESAALKVEDEEALRAILARTCLDMLAACGVTATPADPTPSLAVVEHHIAGFVGFTGRVRGSLVIAASSALFRRTYPLGPEAGLKAPTGDVLDWAGEMANQTLGRIKRRFCDRGVDFDTSSPAAIIGRHITGRSGSRQGVFELAFNVAAEIVSVCFEVIVPSSGVIFPTPARPIPCSAEGELVLF